MNSACIIAACAANARAAQKKKDLKLYAHYFDKDFEIYYKIKFRMYLHFNPIEAIKPSEQEYLFGSVYAPFKAKTLQKVSIPPMSLAKEHIFLIHESRCPSGPDKFVKDNTKRFEETSIWKAAKEELTKKYIDDVTEKYGVTLDNSYLNYSVQYCWEVDCG